MGTGVGAGRYYSGNKSYKLEVTDNCLTLSAASRYGRWGDFLVQAYGLMLDGVTFSGLNTGSPSSA